MALTELIIHRGMASTEKTESLSKKEVNDILKFGAENLFKEEDEEGKGENFKIIVLDNFIKNWNRHVQIQWQNLCLIVYNTESDKSMEFEHMFEPHAFPGRSNPQ